MAKDAKGHGSEARGGGSAAHQTGVVQATMPLRAPGGGRPLTQDEAGKLLSGSHIYNPKSDAVEPIHPSAPTNPRYNREAVQSAINSSNRSGRRIGGREASLIHRLLSNGS